MNVSPGVAWAAKVKILMVAYHLPRENGHGLLYLPKRPGNFKWNVILSPRMEIFSRKNGFLERYTKSSKSNFWVETVRFICWFLIITGLLNWIVFDPVFRKKVVEMKQEHSSWNFHSAFDASHLLQLSINFVPREETRWNSWRIMVPHFRNTPAQPRAE